MKRIVPFFRAGRGGCLALCSAATVSAATWLTPAPQPPAGADGDSLAPVLSAAGDTLLFLSSAPDWVAQDVNGATMDAFVRHLESGAVELVSVTPDGVSGNGPVRYATLSPDGRWALFVSEADNLAPHDHNHAPDVFLRDLTTGVTRLVSVAATGTASGNGASGHPSMTPDGRWIAFESAASDLVAGDTNAFRDVFLRDMETGRTYWVSHPLDDPELASRPAGASTRPVISPDGRYVAFRSDAENLAARAAGVSATHLFYAEVATGTIRPMDLLLPDLPVPIRVWPESELVFSRDGQRVAFVLRSLWPQGDAGKGLHEFVFGEADFAAPVPVGGVITFHADWNPDWNFVGPLPAAQSGDWFIEAYPPDVRFGYFPTAIHQAGAGSGSRLMTTNSVLVGDPPEEVPFSQLLAVSADGDTVAFLSAPESGRPLAEALDLALFVHRISTGETRRVSPEADGRVTPASDVAGVTLSADGNRLVWASRYTPRGTDPAQQLFLYDWNRKTVEMITPLRAGEPPYPAAGRSTLSHRCLSADGTVVVFSSFAPNLSLPGTTDGNDESDVWVVEGAGAPRLISVAPGGRAGNGPSWEGVISADGRWVAFTSAASDLTPDDDNGQPDAFLRDRETGVTTRVSADAATLLGVPVACRAADISPDGRWVAYEARPLVAMDWQHRWQRQVLIYDQQNGRSRWVNQHFQDADPERSHQGWHPRFAPDGRWLLLRQAPQIGWDVVWGCMLPTLNPRRISPPIRESSYNFDQRDYAFGEQGKLAFMQSDREAFSARVYDLLTQEDVASFPAGGSPTLSADGRLVAFEQPDGDGVSQIMLRDLEHDTEELISVDLAGTAPANGRCFAPAISPDGRFVIFASRATNLLPQAANGRTQIFCRDREQGVTLLLSFSPDGHAADQEATAPRLSADGRTVLFTSFAANLRGLAGPSPGDLYRVYIEEGQGPALVLRITRLDGGDPLITWPLQPGADYRVEYRPALGGGEWRILNVPWSQEGTQAVLIDITATPLQDRFYRVVQLP